MGKDDGFVGVSGKGSKAVPSTRVDMGVLKEVVRRDIKDTNMVLSSNLGLGLKYEIKSVPLTLLRLTTDYGDSYNRDVDPKRVKKYLDTYNEALLGVIRVSLRKDGYYYIIDGQHRVLLSNKAGETCIPCQIFFDLTLKQEAAMYLLLSKNTKKQSALEIFRAEMIDMESEAYKINSIVSSFGVDIPYNTEIRYKNSVKVVCVVALRETLRSLGEDGFIRTLTLLKNTWKNCPHSYDQRLIMGMRIFMRLYSNEIDDKHFERKLGERTPQRIFAGGKALNDLVSDNGFTLYAMEITQIYNKGIRRSEKRLDVSRLLNKSKI